MLSALLLVGGACSPRDSKKAGPSLRLEGVAAAGVPSEPLYNPCPASVPVCTIMPLGDSLTSGAGDEADGGYRGELFRILTRTGRPFDFQGTQRVGPGSGHEGHPGAHIMLLTSYVDIWLPQYKPNVILMLLGTNDLDIYIQMHIDDYSKILDRMFVLSPDALIIVAAVPLSPFVGDLPAIEFNRQLLTMVKSKAAAGKHIVAVDMHSALQMRDIGPDQTHPFHTGYVKMAQVWNTALDRFMRPAP
jgi:hypothetical protein